MNSRSINRLVGITAGSMLAFSALKSTYYVVDGGERAVIFKRAGGIQNKVEGPGLHFIVPVFMKPIIFDVRTKAKSVKAKTGSKDLQDVVLVLRLLYRPEPEHLPKMLKQLGLKFDEKVLPSIGNEVLKSVVAQYNVEELITQREKVSQEIRKKLTERAADFHIVLDDVSITDLGFSQEYTDSVEAKQVMQQEAERAKFEVMRDEEERKAKVLIGEGQAQAAALLAKSMSTDGFLEMRRIEAMREIAETLSNSRNVKYVPSGSNILMSLDSRFNHKK